MAIEFRNALLGFNKDDVLNYVHHKDAEFKNLDRELNKKIEQIEKELETLRKEYTSALATIGNLTHENDTLKVRVEEYDRKVKEIDSMSSKIGKLYLVSKSSAKTIVSRAEESSDLVSAQADRNLEGIENTQASLKEIADSILSASQNFVSKLDALQDSLDEAKQKVNDNKTTTSKISEEFAELYAKLG